MKAKALIVSIIILLFILYQGMYTVDETQQVVVTQFGKAVGKAKTKAGLYFKLPIVQQANYFPKNLLEWDGDPGQVPTLDKTFIWVDTFARWKIVDPLKFFQTVNNVTGGMARLDDIIGPSLKPYVSVFIHPCQVAGEVPSVHQYLLQCFAVPVSRHQTWMVTGNCNLSHLALLHRIAIFIKQLDICSRHGFSHGARPDFYAVIIADKTARFGLPVAIVYFQSVCTVEPVDDLPVQCLSRTQKLFHVSEVVALKILLCPQSVLRRCGAESVHSVSLHQFQKFGGIESAVIHQL